MPKFDSIFFPAPTPSYSANNPKLLHIKRLGKEEHFIPCWFERFPESERLLLYFHGNAEDVQISSYFMQYVSQYLKVSVLAVEYPGYGQYLYKDKKISKDLQMKQDAEQVLLYLEDHNIKREDIIILGRSIGTGPATHLASASPGVQALILMSPYTSLRRLAKEFVGSVLSYMVTERFENINDIVNVDCPIMLLHGRKDSLIKCRHSERLKQVCDEHDKSATLVIRDTMTHNDFSLVSDFTDPVIKFLPRVQGEGSKEAISKIRPGHSSKEKEENIEMDSPSERGKNEPPKQVSTEISLP